VCFSFHFNEEYITLLLLVPIAELNFLTFSFVNAVNSCTKQRDFGGLDHGDDQAALLNAGYKPLTQIVQDDSFRDFEFRQYLFACQSKV